jgi:hypothetical protein
VLGSYSLGYDHNPAKLQLVIRTLFERIQAIGFDVPSARVTAVPLFETLDGTDSSDYVQRVEPSVSGGQKLACALLNKLHGS